MDNPDEKVYTSELREDSYTFFRHAKGEVMGNNKVKHLWGQDFKVVKEGLDEAQVAAFVNHITKQKEAGIKEEARRKAEEEAGKIVSKSEQGSRQIIEEARKRGESEAKRLIHEADLQSHRIIDEAKKKARPEANKVIAEAEQQARQIIEKTKRQE